MALEPPSREYIYAQLKDMLRQGLFPRGERIDLQELADQFRLSVTPIREILHELMGERLVEAHPITGYQPLLPDAVALAQLYAWNGQHLLAAIHLLPEPVLRKVIAPFARTVTQTSEQGLGELFGRLAEAFGIATGNDEFLRQINSANDRLHRARISEALLFNDRQKELRSMLKINGLNVRNNVRRRILAYHRRRVEHAVQIEALIP